MHWRSVMGGQRSEGSLAFIYRHFWNTNIQFKDGIKHYVCRRQFELLVSASVIAAEAEGPWRTSQRRRDTGIQAAVRLSCDHLLQASTEVLPPPHHLTVYGAEIKQGFRVCMCQGQSTPVALPSRKYAFERRVCKVQICWLQVSKYHPRAELWADSLRRVFRKLSISARADVKQNLQGIARRRGRIPLCVCFWFISALRSLYLVNSLKKKSARRRPVKAAQRYSPDVAVHVEQISLTHPSPFRIITLI